MCLGKLIDTNKYAVLAFNIPGNGYDGIEENRIDNYEDFTARDIGRLFGLGLTKIGIDRLYAVIGGSLGGGIAWEMAVLFPDRIENLVPVASDWKASDWILAHNKTLAVQLYGEMRDFFPHNAVEYFVSYYDYYQPEAYLPSTDTYIEKDASINEHIEQMRLSATKALLERKDAIIVATVSSIYGLGDPEAYFSMVLHLFRGDRVDQRSILRRLAELQYQRNELDFSQGTYRVRGDVIDVFPAESDRDAPTPVA